MANKLGLFQGNQNQGNRDNSGSRGDQKGTGNRNTSSQHFRGDRKNGRNFIKEKNYFFLSKDKFPFIDLKKINPGDKKRFYGKLYLKIECLQDFFIGCGQLQRSKSKQQEGKDKLYDTFSYIKDAADRTRLVIPGSSLKGAVVTHLEIFLNEGSRGFIGSENNASKVFFSDLTIQEPYEIKSIGIPERFGPRIKPEDGSIKLYLKDDEAYGHLNDGEEKQLKYEGIMPVSTGSSFEGSINFMDLSLHEIALLDLALGSLRGYNFNFKLGGAKNRGMGLVKVTLDSVKSYWTGTLTGVVNGKKCSFAELEDRLVSVIKDIKQEHKKLEALISKLCKEYGS